jgi:hypothetical protein
MHESRSATLRSPVARAAAVLCLAALASGCASWQVQDGTPTEVLQGRAIDKARITTSDGQQLVLRRPQVRGPVLQGWEDSCFETWGNNAPQCEAIGIPVFEISTVELEEHGNAALILPGVGLLGALVLLVFAL